MSALYNRIEAMARRRGMNITALCTKAGVARSSLGDLKAGRNDNLSRQSIERLAVALQVTPEEILGQEVSGIEPDLLPLVDVLRTRSEVRELVEAMKNASPGEIRTTIRVLEAVKQP